VAPLFLAHPLDKLEGDGQPVRRRLRLGTDGRNLVLEIRARPVDRHTQTHSSQYSWDNKCSKINKYFISNYSRELSTGIAKKIINK